MSDQDVKNDQFGYFVSVEWNGKKPPTAWYTRINGLGFVIRGQGDGEGKVNVLADRVRAGRAINQKEPMGIAFQEGYYLCKNRDTAKMLMRYAKDYGASIALTGRYVPEDFSPTTEDLFALDSIVSATSKRGPKVQGDKGQYVITCMDEVKTYVVELDSQPHTCPMCNSFHITARAGKGHVFQAPDLIDLSLLELFQFWKDTRFANSNRVFEIPVIGHSFEGGEILPTAARVEDVIQVPELTHPMPDDVFFAVGADRLHLLDIQYVASKVISDVNRTYNRLKVLDAYVMAGGRKPYLMAEPESGLDIIDLCYYDQSLTRYL